MPTQKYRVETDKGAYEVEVDAPAGGDHSTEPGTYAGGVAKSIGNDLRQFATGVVDTVNPMTYWEGAKAKAAADDKMVEDAKASQGKPLNLSPSNIVPNLKTMAANTTNPLADPRTVGNLAGGLAVGKYAPEALPEVAKPAIRIVGKGLQAAGDNPFAARLAGGAAVVSGLYKGDPEMVAAGAAGAAMPPVLSATGRKLRIMSGESPAVVKLGKAGVDKLNSQFDEAMVKRGMQFHDEQVAGPAAEAAKAAAEEDAAILKAFGGNAEAAAKFKAQGAGPAKPKPGAPGDVPNNPKARALENERQDAIKPDVPNNPAAARVEEARQETLAEATIRRMQERGTLPTKAVAKIEPLSQPQLDKATEMNLKNSPVFKDFIDSGAANGDRTVGAAGRSPLPVNSKGVISEGDLQRLSTMTGIKPELLRNAKVPPSVMEQFLIERELAANAHRSSAGMNSAASAAAARERPFWAPKEE